MFCCTLIDSCVRLSGFLFLYNSYNRTDLGRALSGQTKDVFDKTRDICVNFCIFYNKNVL